ncbi:MAG: hypothetical protein L6R37_007234 [Teloschistes peruensis]|nr:MAG: hypothetical protein L6R37_007234 [Teloschistes peruensis]
MRRQQYPWNFGAGGRTTNWRFPFYTVTIDRFVNGDPTNDDSNGTAWEHDITGTQLRFGGDVSGFQDSLDYLAGMGIRGVYIAGSPLINAPWGADAYSPLDMTLLDPHLGTIKQWQDLIADMHSRGMYVIIDNTMATMGDLIGFEGYLNSSTPLSYTEHNALWKDSRRYHDFDIGNVELPECEYPRFWGSDGILVTANGTENFKGCRDSEFDQYGDVAAFGLYPEWQRQISKFASVQDRLREWRPSVRAKIEHLNCLQIMMLDLDGFRMDKGLQITADAEGEWTYNIRKCAAAVGKHNFFIPGEIVGGNQFSAVYIGRGKDPSMIEPNAFEAVQITANSSDPSRYIRDTGKTGFDSACFHYTIYRNLKRFLGLDGYIEAHPDAPVDIVDAYNNFLVTNDFVNADTGIFDPRHMFGAENQDVFRWPSIENGTLKGGLANFITTLLLPGIPLLVWGQEQSFYILDNTASNYVYGRQPIASNTAWQDHGCYKLGNSRQANWPPGPYSDGCGDDWNSLDHRDPSHPVRNIIATMFELRARYPVLNDGYKLETLSNSTYDIFLPASYDQPTELGLRSVVRSRYPEFQDLSGQGQGNQSVWFVYHNEGINKTYSFNCSDNDTALISPFVRGIKVKNLLFPFQVYTLEGMPQKPGKLTMNFDYGASLPITAIEDPTKQAGCLSKFSLPPFGYQAIVPYDKWLNPSPVVTKFVPGHDRRLLTNASRINVPIKFHFSDVMVCEEVLRSLTVRSDTEDGFQASIDPSSIDCKNVAVADSDVSSLTGKPLGEIPSTFSFAANLVDVSNGIHSIIVGNLTTREGKTSTNAVHSFWFRVGRSDNPIVFPRAANYSSTLLYRNPNESLYITHKASGADKFRYSLNWASSWSDWLPYKGGNSTLDPQPWSGTKTQSWTGVHVMVQYWSRTLGSSDYIQQGDLSRTATPRRYPHMFVHGTYNSFGYDNGLRHTMEQNRQGIWKFNFMTEWPTVFQLSAWGINPDGTPDLTRVFGDPDEDGILDRLSPVSLLENVVNVTSYPPSPFVAYQIAANDGSLRYTLTPIGLRRNQMIIYFLLMFVPLLTSIIGVLSYRHIFYAVKLNEVGKPENRSILPTYIRPSGQLDRYLSKANSRLFRKSKDDSSSSMETAEYDSVDMFQLVSGKRRRTVLIATMEYDIEDWGIKIKIGGLGVMAHLMGKHLTHQDLIWVIPCVGGINYPVDYRAEPMRIIILGEERIVQVYYHKLRNITYVCLDAPIFRSQSKTEPYPARMDDIESAIYYSAWNSCIAEAMKRFPVDLYHINDYHGAIAPLHLLPQIIPCCLSLHNAEFQGLWAIRNPEEMEEISSVYNLSEEVVRQYVQFGEVFNLLHGAVRYLRVWQRGYGVAGVSAKYGKRSFARYPIFWGLSKIDSLPNPDPTDTADWNNELPKMADTKIDPEAEAARAGLKLQAQEWANLESNPEAELFVFVGRWSMQKGVDLIADIFPAVLEEHPRTQLICVGPVIDLYGRFAALKLNKLMELYPGRVFSKPEFTALPPFIFSGAEFALIPSRDEPFGLVAVEFGRKGALGVGSRVGGLGNMPGWWFTVESTTTKHLLRQFKSAIRAALASKPADRAKMRARSAIQRFPVAHWKQQLANIHEIAIKVNQKAAIKHGIEIRGEYNASLASSTLPSSNISAAATPSPLSISSEKVEEEDDDLEELPPNDMSFYDITPPAEGHKRLSLGVRTGPGIMPSPKSTSRIIRYGVNQGSSSSGTKHHSDKSHKSTDKGGSIISQKSVGSNLSSRTPSPITKRRQSRVNTVRNSLVHALARFRFSNVKDNPFNGPRLTGDSTFDEKAQDRVQAQVQRQSDEVSISPLQATENEKMSMVNIEQARLSVLKRRTNVPDHDKIMRASVQQLPSDAYLALIGKSLDDEDMKRSSSGISSIPKFPHPPSLQTSVTPSIPDSSTVRDFATMSSPPARDQARTTTFETKRGTITFGGASGVTSTEHPVVDSNRFSYGTVLQGKKDYALQNVEPFFTDPTGLYYKAFHLELKDLNSKNSESALCIEDFLTMSEKDWYNRLHKVKMGRSASNARPASNFYGPWARGGSVGSIFNGSVDSVAVSDNSAEQFLLKEQYEPPKGLKKLLLRRPRQWPFYSFLLAFGQIIAANSYQVTLISGQVGQSANMLYIIASIYLATSILWWILFRTLKSIYVLSIPFGFYGLAFLLLGVAAYAPGAARGWMQNVATGIYATASSSGAFYFALNFGSEGSVPVATWSFRACVIQGTQQIYVTVLWLWGNHLTRLNARGAAATWQTYRPVLTGICIPVAVLLWGVGIVLFLGLPDYYRQNPGQVPSFYASWFFIAVILQNYFLSAPFGRNWQYLWSSQHAPAWSIVLLVLLFFVIIWSLILYILALLSVHHSWIIPIAAIGLGAPRWSQMLWATSGMGTWVPWAGGPVAGALTGRVLWLWLGVLDAVQGVGFGMILLQTLTRLHVTFTLIAAQVLGSIATILARATAPDKDGPGTVFPNLVLFEGEGLKTAGFWTGLLCQVLVCVGFLKFFRKEQLQKP